MSEHPTMLPMRPWARLAEPLVETEGEYADFVAWEHWMLDTEHEALLEPFATIDRVEFYALCCDLWDHRPTALT